MTYQEIERTYPKEFEARAKDKLRYRYPRGESYEDVVRRCDYTHVPLYQSQNQFYLNGDPRDSAH